MSTAQTAAQPSLAAISTLQRTSFRLLHRMRVRWVEVDMQKIVFNGHYLMYLDNAMADYWRALSLPYEVAMHQLGGDLYVKKASLEYHASAKYDDVLDVGLACTRLGNASLTFTGGIFQGDKLLVSAELIYVYANPATQTAQPIPPVLRSLFTRFEAGETMPPFNLAEWQP
jgi:YbgC/YbaW family acyl-CoA thioester hydrolase